MISAGQSKGRSMTSRKQNVLTCEMGKTNISAMPRQPWVQLLCVKEARKLSTFLQPVSPGLLPVPAQVIPGSSECSFQYYSTRADMGG